MLVIHDAASRYPASVLGVVDGIAEGSQHADQAAYRWLADRSATRLRSAPRDLLIALAVGSRQRAGFELEGVGNNLGAE